MFDNTKKTIIAHYLREVKKGVWQVTLMPNNCPNITLPQGSLAEVIEQASMYIDENFPGYSLS